MPHRRTIPRFLARLRAVVSCIFLTLAGVGCASLTEELFAELGFVGDCNPPPPSPTVVVETIDSSPQEVFPQVVATLQAWDVSIAITTPPKYVNTEKRKLAAMFFKFIGEYPDHWVTCKNRDWAYTDSDECCLLSHTHFAYTLRLTIYLEPVEHEQTNLRIESRWTGDAVLSGGLIRSSQPCSSTRNLEARLADEVRARLLAEPESAELRQNGGGLVHVAGTHRPERRIALRSASLR